MRIILVLFFLIAIWCSLQTESRSLGVKSGVRELLLEGLTYHSSLEPTVCQSEECRSVGHTLKASLNESVDPCDDFYEFVCGGWIESHNIPNDDTDQEISTTKELQNQIVEQIKQDVTNGGSKVEPNIINFISDYYESCLDIESRKSVGVEPIRAYLRTAGGWPLAGDPFDDKTFEWQDSVVKSFMRSLFEIQITSDEKKDSLIVLNLKIDYDLINYQLIYENDHINNKVMIEEQKDKVLEQAIRLGAKNDSQTIIDIDEIVKFQGRVAKRMMDADQGSFPRTRVITVGELGQLSNNSVDWVEFLNRMFTDINSTIRVTIDDEVAVDSIAYYKIVPKILSEAPKRVIANYLGWKFVNNLAEHLDINDNETVLQEKCLNSAVQINPFAISRLFVEKSFGKEEKKAGEALVIDIKGSFEDIMKATDWLDSKTRDSALNKLSAIRQSVGYPDWILDDKKLNIDNVARWWFFMMPYTVNAQYLGDKNRIIIPAAIMSYPHFRHSLPAAINYGGVGYVIGHELTHGFDTRGSEYDGTGNKTNWWTDSVRQKFNDKANCFRQEYSNTIDKQTGLHLHGNDTVGEDIADNGGVQEAFRAYQKFVKREAKLERLPVIDKYSADQQFFISMGNFYCTKATIEQTKQNIKQDQHTLSRYRVNIPLANFETFSDVFKCPINSRMNRKNKCVLW